MVTQQAFLPAPGMSSISRPTTSSPRFSQSALSPVVVSAYSSLRQPERSGRAERISRSGIAGVPAIAIFRAEPDCVAGLRNASQGSHSVASGASWTFRPLIEMDSRRPSEASCSAYHSPAFSMGGVMATSGIGRPICDRSRCFRSALSPSTWPP